MLLRELDTALEGPTDDPVVQRLFPPAVEGEQDEDAELRMLIAGDLLLRRREAIRAVLEVLDRAQEHRSGDVVVELTEDEPGMMLAVLNDIRLALAARVGTTAVELRQLVDEDDARTHGILELVDMLAWFQMQLLEHIDPVAARHDAPEGG